MSGAPGAIKTAVVLGGPEVGEALVDDARVRACISATGSTRMGRAVAPRVAGRFGRLLLGSPVGTTPRSSPQ